MQLLKALWALAGAALCCFLVLVIHAQFLKEGQLAAGTCEIVTLDRDSSQPRRTIARQTARCACRKGQIAGTTRARPACVDARIIKTKQWCDMLPCLEGEGCDLLINRSGWTCTQPGGRIKTTTVGARRWLCGGAGALGSRAYWGGVHPTPAMTGWTHRLPAPPPPEPPFSAAGSVCLRAAQTHHTVTECPAAREAGQSPLQAGQPTQDCR
ncbi:chemokine-like protein TAFA-5 isoform X2 [Monodon monoceros]|uniref:chemokine-like protein TAFA-5 isoform X2 n=1 Tax=Monodon monoceros TaxID=40151 RepID=UPI0010F9C9F1|nr:chemokine-like protein TAFA-5 isoform X2 [Monodon monoceros]